MKQVTIVKCWTSNEPEIPSNVKPATKVEEYRLWDELRSMWRTVQKKLTIVLPYSGHVYPAKGIDYFPTVVSNTVSLS
jgi:hypothetical protein